MKNLAASAAAKYFAGLLLCMLLVFLPAGTLHFAGGWLFLGVLFLPMLVMGLVLLTKNPELLEKRIGVKEEQSAQKMVVKLSGLMFLGGFVLSGLDYRFQWMQLPLWCKIAAAVIFLLGYGMYAEVLRENTYLSRTVEVQENQVRWLRCRSFCCIRCLSCCGSAMKKRFWSRGFRAMRNTGKR